MGAVLQDTDRQQKQQSIYGIAHVRSFTTVQYCDAAKNRKYTKPGCCQSLCSSSDRAGMVMYNHYRDLDHDWRFSDT